jgi:hypothetical protein
MKAKRCLSCGAELRKGENHHEEWCAKAPKK